MALRPSILNPESGVQDCTVTAGNLSAVCVTEGKADSEKLLLGKATSAAEDRFRMKVKEFTERQR